MNLLKDSLPLRHRCILAWAFAPGIVIDNTKYVPMRKGVLIVPRDASYMRFLSGSCIHKADYKPSKDRLVLTTQDLGLT